MQRVAQNPHDPGHSRVLDGILTYGVDCFGPPPNQFDRGGTVVIPEIDINITDDQLRVIQAQFDPM